MCKQLAYEWMQRVTTYIDGSEVTPVNVIREAIGGLMLLICMDIDLSSGEFKEMLLVSLKNSTDDPVTLKQATDILDQWALLQEQY